MGRPTKKAQKAKKISEGMTKNHPELVKKLEEAFAIDASVEEACFYAGISRQTFYTWINKNKELRDRLEGLRNKPVLKARQTIVKNLDEVDTAKWYAERKRKSEFSTRVEQTGAGGGPLEVELTPNKYGNIARREAGVHKAGSEK